MLNSVLNMRSLVILWLIGISVTSTRGIDVEFSNAIQKGLRNAMSNYLLKIEERISKVLMKPLLVESKCITRELTPAVIEKALYNINYLLPETIPMIPFAVAEPAPNNILFYFGIVNSYFRNITNYTCNATVKNTAASSVIGVDFHLNTSSLLGHYELDVSNYDMHLYGDGDYSITANGTVLSVLTNFEISMDNSFKMTDFLYNISINSAQLTMNNLLGGDPSAQVLTQALSDKMPAEIASLTEVTQHIVNSSVADITNSYVASVMSWSDVVSLIYDLADM